MKLVRGWENRAEVLKQANNLKVIIGIIQFAKIILHRAEICQLPAGRICRFRTHFGEKKTNSSISW